MFLLDTDHVGIIQRMAEPEFNRLSTRMGQHPATAFYVSIITFQEQLLGWNAFINLARTREAIIRGYQKLQGILTDFAVARPSLRRARLSLFRIAAPTKNTHRHHGSANSSNCAIPRLNPVESKPG